MAVYKTVELDKVCWERRAGRAELPMCKSVPTVYDGFVAPFEILQETTIF